MEKGCIRASLKATLNFKVGNLCDQFLQKGLFNLFNLSNE